MKARGFRWSICVAVSCLTVSVNFGCTRELGGDSSLVMAVPKALNEKLGTQAVSGQLAHIIINIKGPGMTPIIWTWDGEESSGNILPAPAKIEINNVPSGSGRIIQYLGAYRTLTGGLQFTYGDSLQDLSGGNNNIKIKAFAFGSSTKEGQLVGRYLTGADVGPTGRVIGSIQPPATASVLSNPPPMEIFNSGIYSGWFKFMVFDGDAKFTYRMPELGLTLFDSVSLSDAALNPSGVNNQRMRVSVPSVYRSHDGYIDNAELEPATDIVYGFFGPGSSSMNICYQNTGGTIPAFYTSVSDTSPADGIIDETADVYWAGDTTCLSGYICVEGGGTTSCGTTLWSDYIEFDPMTLDEGSDGRLLINGAFQGTTISGGLDYVQVSSGSDYITASWTLLPGILSDSNSISGISVYLSKTGYTDGDYHGSDDLPCNIVAVENGFSFYKDVAKTTNSVTVNNLTTDEANNGNVVLCPYKNTNSGRFYFPEVVESHHSGI